MKKIFKYVLLVAGILFLLQTGALNSLAATIYTWELSDTINTARLKYNSSTQNLNSGLSGGVATSSGAFAGRISFFDPNTSTLNGTSSLTINTSTGALTLNSLSALFSTSTLLGLNIGSNSASIGDNGTGALILTSGSGDTTFADAGSSGTFNIDVSTSPITLSNFQVSGLTFTNATATGNVQTQTLSVSGFSSLQNITFVNATGTGNLQAATLKSTGATNVSSTLDVTGAGRFASTLGVTGVSSLAGITFTNATGTTISIGGGVFEANNNGVGIGAPPRVSGGLFLDGTDLIINGAAVIVEGSATSTIYGDGTTSVIGSGLSVGGLSALQGITFTNATGTNLSLTGNANVSGTMNVTGRSGLTTVSSTNQTLSGSLQAQTITFTNATGTGNLTVDSLNITNGDEYRLRTASVVIMNPTSTAHSSGTVTISFPVASTIVGVECYSIQTGTSTIAFDKRATSTPTTAGTSVMANLACGGSNSTTTFASPAMTAGSLLNLTLSSTGAPSSTAVFIKFRTND